MTIGRPTITGRHLAFSTPWFEVITKSIEGDAPHDTVRMLAALRGRFGHFHLP